MIGLKLSGRTGIVDELTMISLILSFKDRSSSLCLLKMVCCSCLSSNRTCTKHTVQQQNHYFELAHARLTMALQMPSCISNLEELVSSVQAGMKARQQANIKFFMMNKFRLSAHWILAIML